ncbi:MAG: site-specific DNA-methyltransferase [Calditrichaeota bacterium]|nr:site-specific DNA-methyltransferase [Calditrichota bacterium]
MTETSKLIEGFHAINWDFPDSTNGSLADVHPYPARFIPEIPAAAIKLLKPQGSVLDPFCGSGTTLVEALRYGLPAVGVDLSPIACLITRVKVGTWSPADGETLFHHRNHLVAAALEGDDALLGVLQEHIPRLDHWFAPWAQRLLAGAVGYLGTLDRGDPWTDRVALAISASTVRISRQESDTRYAAVDKSINREAAARELGAALDRIAAWLRSSQIRGQASVFCADARELDFLPEGEAGAAIFSPPYPNAYEYWLYHKYRMYWLGFDPIAMRAQEIGARPHYVGANGQDEHDFAGQMRDVLKGVHRALRPQARMLIVIGDSQIRGRLIDNGQLLHDVAVDEGFKPLTQTRRVIRRSRTSFNRAHSRARSDEHVLLMERCE